MDTVRIGFVGLGGIARQRHMPGLHRIPDVEVRAVVNRTPESTRRVADEFGIPITCESWRELVTRDDIDAIFIGTWPYLHCPISVAALEAGKHVFTQARMAMNVSEARRMLETAHRSGLTAMICPVPFGLNIDATIHRFMAEGNLGDIRYVRVESLSDAYADPTAPMNWRKDHRLSGLNVLTLGMYIEVMHRWFGKTRAISADMQIFTPIRTDDNGIPTPVEIPDQIMAIADMPGGFPIQYTFSGVTRHPSDLIEIEGSQASLRYEVGTGQLFAARPGEPFTPVTIRPEDVYDVDTWRVEADFINAIRTGAPYHPTFEEGLWYMQVIEAIYTSAREQRRIGIEG